MRVDPADPRPEPWYVNAQIFRFFMPWTVWMSVGLIAAAVSVWRRERNAAQLALWLVLVPLVVMSFFAERKPRYILPIIPAAAVLSAWPLVHVMRGEGLRWLRHVQVVLHWGCVVAIPLAGIVLASQRWRLPDGTPWIAWPVALTLALTLVVLILFAVMFGKRRETPLLIVTGVAMLAFDAVYVHGNSRDTRGRSEMKPLADAIAATAPNLAAFSYFPADPSHSAPPDLSIYLNRVVRPVTSMDAIGTDGPAVVVVGTLGKGDMTSPANSQYVSSARRGGITWRAWLTSTSTPE
jgi:hypothetical protein